MKGEGSQKRENSGSQLEHFKHETQSAATRQVKTYQSLFQNWTCEAPGSKQVN